MLGPPVATLPWHGAMRIWGERVRVGTCTELGAAIVRPFKSARRITTTLKDDIENHYVSYTWIKCIA